MRTRTSTALIFALIATMGGSNCLAQTPSDARKILDANKDAVVTLQMVVETTSTYEGESDKRESKLSVTATVVDPSGLVVASNTETSPSDMFSRLFEDEMGFKTSTKTIDVKIRTADGTEMPADVVLRDPDLDLAFIRPKRAPEKPMAYVDLSQGSTPESMDELVVLSRLGTIASRSIAATIDRVRAVVAKPRTFYVMNANMHSSMGGPAFSLDGKPAGIMVIRMSLSKDQDRRSFSNMDEMMMAAVLPCSTVLGVVDQARKAAPPKEEPKPAAKSE